MDATDIRFDNTWLSVSRPFRTVIDLSKPKGTSRTFSESWYDNFVPGAFRYRLGCRRQGHKRIPTKRKELTTARTKERRLENKVDNEVKERQKLEEMVEGSQSHISVTSIQLIDRLHSSCMLTTICLYAFLTGITNK